MQLLKSKLINLKTKIIITIKIISNNFFRKIKNKYSNESRLI